MGYPRMMRSRNFKLSTRTAGSVTATASWAAVDTATDITIACQAGDVLQAGVSAFWTSIATFGRLDCVLVPSGTVTSSFSGTYAAGSTTTGVPGWLGITTDYTPIGAAVMKVLSSSDVVSGLTVCRLMLRADAASGKQLVSQASDPLQFWVRNLGPQDAT